MERASKIIECISSTMGSVFEREEQHPMAQCTGGDNTVIIEKRKYEELKETVGELSREVKQLREINDQNQSLLHEYEGTFTAVLQRNLERVAAKPAPEEFRTHCAQASEERMRSHIRALTRDLALSEEQLEQAEEKYGQRMALLEEEKQNLSSLLESERKLREEQEMKLQEAERLLSQRTEELVEVIGYCKYLNSECGMDEAI